MSNIEKAATIIGTALLGASVAVLIQRQRSQITAGDIRRAARKANDAPIEVLGETLKEAWAPYHTR